MPKAKSPGLLELLREQIEAEAWGDIDSYWFEPYKPEDYGREADEELDEESEEYFHMKFQELLKRVETRLKTK